MQEIHLSHAVTDDDYQSAFGVMRELRPHLVDSNAFAVQARRQAAQGYVLLIARRGGPEGPVLALAGYRHLENLLYGRFVYVDDLVATERARNQHLGERLLDAVRDEARQSGCAYFVLDTGLANALAQRFYSRQGLLSRGLHFSQPVASHPMNTILFLEASPHGDNSLGTRLAREFITQLQTQHSHARVVLRNLSHPALPALPALSADYARALVAMQPNTAPTFACSEQLIGELEQSDCLVISTPMHNFTVPAALKLWIDLVSRVGRTFKSHSGRQVRLARGSSRAGACSFGWSLHRRSCPTTGLFLRLI